MAAFTYTYRVRGINKAPAQVAGEIMEQLEQSEHGLSPASLLDASRDENAPLHGEFEWDDAKAAEGYRLHQAANLIRNIVITVEETNEPERAFVANGERQSAYVALQSALTNEAWKASLLEAAKRDMQAFAGKYRRLEQLAEVINAMAKVS